MNLSDALLDSWDRQARTVHALALLVDESNRDAKPSPDGMSLEAQLAHIHQVRRYWLSQLSPELAGALPRAVGEDWVTPCLSLDGLRDALDGSALAVRRAVAERLVEPIGPVGAYDNPVLYLQHMVWHEGWHVGLIMLGLRLAGQEPAEEWEEAHLWGQWRTE